MRHKFFKRSAEKFDCRIDPEVKEETTSTSGSRVIFRLLVFYALKLQRSAAREKIYHLEISCFLWWGYSLIFLFL